MILCLTTKTERSEKFIQFVCITPSVLTILTQMLINEVGSRILYHRYVREDLHTLERPRNPVRLVVLRMIGRDSESYFK